MKSCCIEILDLGLIDFDKALFIQKDILNKRSRGDKPDVLILAEHTHVFTLGRSAIKENLLVSEETLSSMGISVRNVDRGGDISYHGPGQLMLYPIILLGTARRDLHKYMRDLEEVVIRFLKLYSVDASRIAGRTGVWVGDDKIASIGVASKSWITYHGIGLNINTDLGFFDMIKPCGFKDIKMVSLRYLYGGLISMDEVKSKIVTIFCDIFY